MKELIGDHWQSRTSYYSREGEGYTEYPELVLLSDDEDNDRRVLSISIEEGKVCFNEKCDDWFCIRMSHDEAITALEEAIAWIKEQSNG